jgi:hypothetical protein
MRLFLALYVFAVIFLSGCNGEIRDFDITQYEKATVVGTISQEKNKSKISLTTSECVNITLSLLSIDSIYLRFQDENNEREIYHTYFIDSVEIRQLKDKDLLYLKVSSAYDTRYSEWYREKKIFIYSLAKRKVIGWVKIEKG